MVGAENRRRLCNAIVEQSFHYFYFYTDIQYTSIPLRSARSTHGYFDVAGFIVQVYVLGNLRLAFV